MRKTKPTDFSMALADYLFVFLPTQKGLSENTIRSYSDTLELFLRFIENERGIKRERLEIAHISRPVVEDFLAWLETERGSSASTRNQRRVALNGFFRYLQYRNPGYVLFMPADSFHSEKSRSQEKCGAHFNGSCFGNIETA